MKIQKYINIMMCSLVLTFVSIGTAHAPHMSSSPVLFHHGENNCSLQFGYGDTQIFTNLENRSHMRGVAAYGLWMGCGFGDETTSFLLDFALSPAHVERRNDTSQALLAGFTHLAMGLKVVPYQTKQTDLVQVGFSLFTKGFSALTLFEEDQAGDSLLIIAGAEVGISIGYSNEMNFFGTKLFVFIEPFFSAVPAHFSKLLDSDIDKELIHNLMRIGITIQATWEGNPTPLIISSSTTIDADNNLLGWHNGIGLTF